MIGGIKMELDLFNMDFGESILIRDKSTHINMLLDYGSEIIADLDNVQHELIKIKKSEETTNAMLSHFHDDHINGYINLAKNDIRIFDTIYVPNVFNSYNKESRVIIDYVTIEVILFFLNNYNLNEKGLSLFDLLNAISINNISLQLMGRGNTFNIGQYNYTILWPSINHINFMLKTSELQLISFLNVLESLSNEELNLYSRILLISKGIRELYNQYNTNNGDISEGYKKDLKDLDEKINKLQEITKKHNVSKSYMTDNIKNEVREWISKLKRDANKVSIVFQNSNDTPNENILMTGDIDKVRFNWIINNKIKPSIPIYDSYAILKAPHHGTKSHFVNNIPRSCFTLISNGNTSKGKRGKIAYEYYRLETLKLCTNEESNRCEALSDNNLNDNGINACCKCMCYGFDKRDFKYVIII